MSSFPTARAQTRPGEPGQGAVRARAVGLVQVLTQLPDPRGRRGRRHSLVGILLVALAAVLAGARSYAAIGQWAAELTAEQLGLLGINRPSAPEVSTFRRVLAGVDAAVLDSLIGAFLWARTCTVAGRRVIALDGKTVRGARTAQAAAPHLVSAFDQATGTVLGQLATAAKSNEIPTVRTVLAAFDLTGVVVTVDAMHTQTDTAQAITGGGGDYVFTVKANQPRLYAACKNLPWRDVPAHSSVQTGHGRRVRRTIKVLTAPTNLPGWVDFTGAAQLAQIRRTTKRRSKNSTGKTTVEVVYVITSADHHTAPPAVLAAWVQGHWGIENRAHWVRDVTFDEDRSQIRTGHGPQVMATLRNTAISLLRLAGATNIAAALRHHARQPDRPLDLLLTS
jgi:predicted transposase YbfD/YdcC